jgi:hypothetical protein
MPVRALKEFETYNSKRLRRRKAAKTSSKTVKN